MHARLVVLPRRWGRRHSPRAASITGQSPALNPGCQHCTAAAAFLLGGRGSRITGRSPATNPTVSAHRRGRKTVGRFLAPHPRNPRRRAAGGRGVVDLAGTRDVWPPTRHDEICGRLKCSHWLVFDRLPQQDQVPPWYPPPIETCGRAEKRRGFPAGARSLPGTWSAANGQKFAAGGKGGTRWHDVVVPDRLIGAWPWASKYPFCCPGQVLQAAPAGTRRRQQPAEDTGLSGLLAVSGRHQRPRREGARTRPYGPVQ